MVVRNPRNGIVAALLFATLLSNAPYSVGTDAQMGAACARELDRQDRALKSFAADLKKQNLDFISTDAVGQSLTDVKDTLKGQPDQVALRKVQDLRDKTQAFAKQMMTYAEVMSRMSACLNGGAPGCLTNIVNQQSAEIKRWLQALSEQMIGEAAARVNNARTLLQSYAEGASSMATGSIARGLEACESEVQKAADANKPAADTRARPAPGGGGKAAAAPPAEKGGISGGTKALIGLGAVGGVALIFKDDLQGLAGGGDAKCGPQPSIDFDYRVQSRPSDAQLAALKAWCSCQNWGYGQVNGGFGCLK